MAQAQQLRARAGRSVAQVVPSVGSRATGVQVEAISAAIARGGRRQDFGADRARTATAQVGVVKDVTTPMLSAPVESGSKRAS
jgi:hypothetical protein